MSADQASHAQIYARLLRAAAPYWRVFALSVVAMLGAAATDPAFAALMKPLLDGSFVERDPQAIRIIPVVMVGLFLVRMVVTFVAQYGMSWVARHLIQDLRTAMFRHLLRLPAAYFDRHPAGVLISKLTYDVERVAGAATEALTALVKDTATIIGLMGWMFYLNWRLALIFVVVGPLVAWCINVVSRRFRSLSRRMQASMGNMTAATEEAIGGHLVTKVFGGQTVAAQDFRRLAARNRQLQMKWVSVDNIGNSLIQLMIALTLAGIVYAASTVAANDRTTVGGFTSFIVAMTMLQAPVKRLTKVNGVIQRGLTAARSVFGLLDEAPEQDRGTRVLGRARGAVAYRDVHFSYATSKRPVLSGVSFEVEPGQTVALIGRSGSGKSTLVSLLPRFYELQHGCVEVDGVDTRELTLESLRDQIALVSQHVVLFNDTVHANIAYARRAEATREQVRRAAALAHADSFIESLPNGYDSLVGDNGVLLSGGQRQRLAIARALLKNAPILILDEATSALDTESEQHIQAALRDLMRTRTTLVIAHRLSTIEGADLILVMDEGRIVERGTHSELLRAGGSYARLHRMQFGAARAIG